MKKKEMSLRLNDTKSWSINKTYGDLKWPYAIISFAKANLTYEQVKDLIKPFSPDYLVGQEFRKGVY